MKTPREQAEKFIDDTEEARQVSERCRDYYDGKQWTDAEIAKLAKRNQAAIVVNRIKPKVEGLLGLYGLRKSDPKAYARTQKHEAASHAATDALRYVADNTNFDSTRMDVAGDFFVEGYGGAIVEVKQKRGEFEVQINQIPWDRIYFDPHSRALDFNDSSFFGLLMWMYVDKANQMFPSFDWEAVGITDAYIDETFEDRPKWVDRKENRVRIALHFEEVGGIWHMSVSFGDLFVLEPQVSPFVDCDGDPANPIELVSSHIDRENNRYSEVKGFLDQQDEINHRRSKFLHFLNTRQTFGREGSPDDITALKRELSKPDGHINFHGDKFGTDFGVLPPAGESQGQFELYMDAKAELDSVSINAQLSGERQQGDLSGVAIGKLQQAGTLELNRQYSLLSSWETRIYRQVWARIKQFWTEEKWIRVTDDQDNLRWVGFNTAITVQQALEEKINDESEQPHVRRIAAKIYTGMIQQQDPRLQELVDVQNPVAELDVDIIIDQSFDAINVQEEQFKMLAQFGQSGGIDIIELLEVSQLRGKDELIEKIEKRRAEAAQQQGGAVQIAAQKEAAGIENVQADTAQKFTKARQTNIETELLIANPDTRPQAII